MVASRSSFADRPSLNLTHRSGNRGVLSSQVKLTTSSAHLNHKCLLLMSLTYISGLTLSIPQLTTFYRKMMSRGGGSGRGRPHKLPGVVAPSKVKRICGAEGCGVQVVGTELPHHYKARTDFKKLGQLRKMATEVAEEELKGLDPHTVYMFIRNFCN